MGRCDPHPVPAGDVQHAAHRQAGRADIQQAIRWQLLPRRSDDGDHLPAAAIGDAADVQHQPVRFSITHASRSRSWEQVA